MTDFAKTGPVTPNAPTVSSRFPFFYYFTCCVFAILRCPAVLVDFSVPRPVRRFFLFATWSLPCTSTSRSIAIPPSIPQSSQLPPLRRAKSSSPNLNEPRPSVARPTSCNLNTRRLLLSSRVALPRIVPHGTELAKPEAQMGHGQFLPASRGWCRVTIGQYTVGSG